MTALKSSSEPTRFEPRWPVALAIAMVVAVYVLLPGRIRLLPIGFAYVVGVAVLAPIAAVGLTAAHPRWLRAERTVTLLLSLAMAPVSVVNLANLIYLIARGSTEVDGLRLLESSVALWVGNVLSFSLLYWQIDQGGPEARVNHTGARTDWLFPQKAAPAQVVPAEWEPTFVDYLYLSYSTATAFSTTDVMPLTARAKLLMMFESMISLATIVVVAARAINILGS